MLVLILGGISYMPIDVLQKWYGELKAEMLKHPETQEYVKENDVPDKVFEQLKLCKEFMKWRGKS